MRVPITRARKLGSTMLLHYALFVVYWGLKIFTIWHTAMQEVDMMNLFTYQPNYELKWHVLEKMVYFDFYNGEWVGYLTTQTGKKVCMLTSASKIQVEKELAAFESLDEAA